MWSLVAVLALVALPVGQTAPERPCSVFGRFGEQLDGLEAPIAVAYAPDGRLAVLERDAGQVRIYAWTPALTGLAGAQLATIRWAGDLAGADRSAEAWAYPAGSSEAPSAVGFSADGRLALVGPARITIFDADGAVWRSLAGVPLERPVAVAWRGEEMLIADCGASAIVVLDSAGRETGRFAEGLRIGGLAIAGDGSVFASDADTHAIVRFDSNGQALGRFGERGAFPGLFNVPLGLAVREQCLYVTDELNHRITIHAMDGKFLGQWGMHAVVPREGEGKIHYPVALAIAPDGSGAVVAEPFERRIQRFGPSDPTEAARQGLPSLKDVQSHFGAAVAVDGDLLVLNEPETASIFVFDLRGPTPIHVTTFGGQGTLKDKFGRVAALAVDAATQRVVVADAGNRRLSLYGLERDRTGPLRLDPFMGRLVRSWDLSAWNERVAALLGEPGSRPALEPSALVRRGDDLLLLDGRSGVVVTFDPRSLEPRAALTTGVRGGTGLAALDDGRLAIAVPDRGEVTVVDAAGTVVGRWRGPAEQPFIRPTALARLDRGLLAVTDAGADRVVLLGADGGVSGAFGERGGSDGDLWGPDGVSRMADGRILVVDRGNHRAQIFAGDGSWLMTFGLGRAYTRPRERGES